jgi:hypothetical protein
MRLTQFSVYLSRLYPHDNFWSEYLTLPHSWLITGFVTILTRPVPLVEQELLTLPENLSPWLVFSGVCVTRIFCFRCMFCRSLFVLFLLAIFVVGPSPIYWFWLHLWYLQTLLIAYFLFSNNSIYSRKSFKKSWKIPKEGVIIIRKWKKGVIHHNGQYQKCQYANNDL